MPDIHLTARESLHRCGARGDEIEELLRYADSGFDAGAVAADREYPLADEPFVDDWALYAREAEQIGAAATLRRHLMQLRFPVEAGMSERDDYRAATRRGVLPAEPGAAAAFADEDGLTIALHPTPAGRLPVIIARARSDFELLVRALARGNEPAPIPPSMGACIIGGYNNWSRVAAWPGAFKDLIPHKHLYQDRFVVLSSGPYSGTPAGVLGLDDDEWLRLSIVIRLEHECAHYFTKRVFGTMRNSLLDELIADYTGVVAARGRFERAWFLRFMGVEHDDRWRSDGRLSNYRGTPPLSDGAFVVLQSMVRRAAAALEEFDTMVRGGLAAPDQARSSRDVARAIAAMAAVGLERIAGPDAAEQLLTAYSDVGATASHYALTS